METDGKLPSGHTLEEAIKIVDSKTDNYNSYFMVNCAHPTHFEFLFKGGTLEPWMKRICGVEVNASKKSHEELENSTELDSGNPVST